MKHVHLFLLALVPLTTFGQKYEFGLDAGLSTNSRAYGNMYYKGEQLVPNYSFGLTFLSNLGNNYQIGLDGGISELSRGVTQRYPDPNEEAIIGNDGRRFVYSKITPALCGLLNKKFGVSDKGYFFGGIAAGAGLTVDVNKTPNSRASYIAPDWGYGPCIGGQMGYVHHISNKISINATASIRDYNFNYDATAPIYKPFSQLHYYLLAYTFNLGIRYSFGTANHANKKEKTQPVKFDKDLSYRPESLPENKPVAKDHIIVSSSEEAPAPIEKPASKENPVTPQRPIFGQTYAILVAVFDNRSTARALSDRIISKFRLPEHSVEIGRVGIDYEVWITGFQDIEEANAYLPKLARLGYPDALVLRKYKK